MKKLVIILIAFSVSSSSLYSQTRTISGRVISDRFNILIGVSIIINDTIKVGETDLNGFFYIEIPVSVKKILFRDGGYEPAIIEPVVTCNEVEVIMILSGTYDFLTLKKVDRLRKKEFKKLPELYKEAFAKSIFKSDKACYTQKFIPYFKKKQKRY